MPWWKLQWNSNAVPSLGTVTVNFAVLPAATDWSMLKLSEVKVWVVLPSFSISMRHLLARLHLHERRLEVVVVGLELDARDFFELMSLVPLTLTLPSTCTGFDALADGWRRPATPMNEATTTAPATSDPELAHHGAPCSGPSSGCRRVYGRTAGGIAPVPWNGAQSLSPGSRSTTVWTVSDETLVAGLAAGDRDAASAFVRRFQRRVFGLARTIVSDDRAAEDIAQEAFVRAWKHAGAFDPRRGSVVGWLLTITRNLAIDAVRVRRPVAFDPVALLGLRRRVERARPGRARPSSSDEPRPPAGRAGAAPRGAVAGPIVLAGLLGYTAREVGEIEDIPLGTAKTRIRTALLRLRAALVSEERTE